MHLIFRKTILYITLSFSSLFAIGTQFLMFPESAYDLAMGSHVSFGGSENVNPSLIKLTQSSPLLYINSGNWYGDIRTSGVNYIHTLGNYNNKIFLKQAGIADLEYRENKPSDEPNTIFGAYGFALGSGFSLNTAVGNFGVTFSALYFTIYDQSSQGLKIDLGYSNVYNNGWGVGVSILNLGSVSTFYQEKPKMPIRLLTGFTKDIELKSISSRLYTTGDFSLINDSWKIKIGNNTNWKQIKLLSGYSFTKHTSSISFGSGFLYGRFGITYAIRMGSQEIGIPQTLSLSFRLP